MLTVLHQKVKIILEGEMWLEAIGPDEQNATLIKAVAGDVIRIKKGTVVRFSSPSHGKGASLLFAFIFLHFLFSFFSLRLLFLTL